MSSAAAASTRVSASSAADSVQVLTSCGSGLLGPGPVVSPPAPVSPVPLPAVVFAPGSSVPVFYVAKETVQLES